jgi:hypothetical protein
LTSIFTTLSCALSRHEFTERCINIINRLVLYDKKNPGFKPLPYAKADTYRAPPVPMARVEFPIALVGIPDVRGPGDSVGFWIVTVGICSMLSVPFKEGDIAGRVSGVVSEMPIKPVLLSRACHSWGVSIHVCIVAGRLGSVEFQ